MEKELKLFSKTHEWVELLDGGRALVGLSSYAVEQLGSIVFVNLPMKGDTVQAEQSFGDVESVKAVSEMISPLTGTVVKVNEAVFDEPGLFNLNYQLPEYLNLPIHNIKVLLENLDNIIF